MTTAIISARVDAKTRELGNARLRSIGKTPNEYINELWEVLAYGDEIPTFGVEEFTKKQIKKKALEELERFRMEHAEQLNDPFLVNLDREGLRKVWEDREF